MPVLDPSSPGNSAHPLRRGKLAALAALTTLALALLGGTGCVAEVHTRTVTPAPATVTYQEFAVVEEPVVHIAAAPVHVETYPRVYYRGTYVYYVDGRWYYPAHHGWVYYREEPRALVHYRVEFERRRPRHHHVHHHHPHHVTTVRPSASVRASASVRPSASIRTAAPARPSVYRSG
ncbi:hypothetical protein ACMHYB_45060 [Sorangium sp. So ce1128]|uniref:hypothetical protein n=1 Tax=Sorangium sp. So ce363 TaxID=3133304 RepID=UPI003F63BDCD